jgi:hypothetical protein
VADYSPGTEFGEANYVSAIVEEILFLVISRRAAGR